MTFVHVKLTYGAVRKSLQELVMKITTFTHLEDYESLKTNTSRRVLIRFPMLTLQTMTGDVSSIMLHTG